MLKAVFFSALLVLALGSISVAAAETPGKFEGQTIPLGLIAEMNQKEVEQYFLEFMRYLARESLTRSKD